MTDTRRLGRISIWASVSITAGVFSVLVVSMAVIALSSHGSLIADLMLKARIIGFMGFASLASVFAATFAILLSDRKKGAAAVLCTSVLCLAFIVFLFINSTSTRSISISITPENVSYWATVLNNP